VTRAVRQRYHRPLGWLVAIAILLHGWLPVLLQSALATAQAEVHGDSYAHHAHHADAPAQPEPDPAPADKGPECPLLGSAVCFCAVLVKVLPAPAIEVPLAAAMARRARGRFPAPRPRRHVRAAPFEARAPPFSG
jgi:hypothetical protein